MIPPLLAISLWPLVSIVFFQRLRLPLAVLCTIIGGYLLLPTGVAFDLPLLPALNKSTVPALTALVLSLIFHGRDTSDDLRPFGIVPRHPVLLGLIILMFAGAVMTVLTNGDPVRYGPTRLPGLRPYDAASTALLAGMSIIPLLLGRRYLADPKMLRLLLIVICVSVVGYAFLALFEARVSPQLSRWVYGFFPHDWRQHVRPGGFRPVVFLNHGLVLGLVLSIAIIATIGLMRTELVRSRKYLLAALWLGLTLTQSQNLGAVMITVVMVPVVLFLGVRLQFIVAVVVMGIFLSYPVARTAHFLPLDRIVAFAESVDPRRASSFNTRLVNEERVLAKSQERPLFGWGGWGRSRVLNDKGQDITIADGAWVTVLGLHGWVGYLARFGLVTIPVFLLFMNRKRYGIGMESSVLALMLAANLIDMVPNSSMMPLTWLMAGALWGRLELQNVADKQTTTDSAAQPQPQYRRADPAAALPPPQSIYTRQNNRFERKKPQLKLSQR